MHEQLLQAAEAEAAVADHADHGHAERGFEPREVDLAAARVQLVHHGERDAHRLAEPQHLRDQEERALERAGVHREHDAVRRRHLRDLAAEHARHHRLVRRERREAVDAGQVDHAHARAADARVALAPLDGHAGVVADARAQPGERVEERRLAGVGAADEPEPDGQRAG